MHIALTRIVALLIISDGGSPSLNRFQRARQAIGSNTRGRSNLIMDMHTQAAYPERYTSRRVRGPLVLTLTALGAILALAIALTSAVAQAGQAGSQYKPTTSSYAPNAPHWQEISRTTNSALLDVDMVSSNSGWAVGEAGTVLYYNGSAWNIVPFSSTGRLVDVHMLSANDGFIIDRENNNVYRWNGTQWSLFYTTLSSPNRIDAISPDDVWLVAVGKIYRCHPCPASGGTWTPEFTNGANIFSIQMFVGSQGTEGWATGAGTSEGALVAHYLNGTWTQYTPSPSTNTLYDSSFTIPSNGWAVGFTSTTYVVRYDGVEWTRAYTLPQSLYRLYMVSPTEGWFTGYMQGGPDNPHGEIVHFFDDYFSTDYIAPDFQYISGIFMLSNTEGWAVGDAGLMVHYVDDTAPSPTATMPATATSSSTATPSRTATTVAGSPTASTTSIPVATSTATACVISFTDVPPDNTFYTFIRCLVCRGVISGYNDGTFRPYNDITRGQIAKIVSNAAGFDEDPGPQVYEDVPESSPFYQWINRLSTRGHIGGYPCGLLPEEPCIEPDNLPYFRPSSSATRGQLAKIVSNAAGLESNPTGQFFTDVAEGHTFYLWIMRLTELGVMGGYDCGGDGEPCDDENRPYFRPFNNVTRGQASKIVANTFFPGCQTPAR
jgi:hypothetical protein